MELVGIGIPLHATGGDKNEVDGLVGAGFGHETLFAVLNLCFFFGCHLIGLAGVFHLADVDDGIVAVKNEINLCTTTIGILGQVPRADTADGTEDAECPAYLVDVEQADTLEGSAAPVVVEGGACLARPKGGVSRGVLLDEVGLEEGVGVDELEEGTFGLEPEIGVTTDEAAFLKLFQYFTKATVVLKTGLSDKLFTGEAGALGSEGLDNGNIRVWILEE